ncbi:MAG: hypothetical protein U0271_19845 [Polyangiaceae bacterium]
MRITVAAGLTFLLAVGCGGTVDVEDGGAPSTGGAGGESASGGALASGGSASTSTSDGGGLPTTTTGTGNTTVTTTSTTTTTSTGVMTCPASSTCAACISVSCPTVWCGCYNNPECGALFVCTSQCQPDDTACHQACYSAHPDGISDAVLAADCAADPCSADCPQAGDPLPPCQECLYSGCADEMNACVAEAECSALYQCLTACAPGQLSCQQACYDNHAAGVQPLEAVLNCSMSACPDVCN